MYAWEKSFSDLVKDLRSSELRCVKIQAYINAGIGICWYNAKYLVRLQGHCEANSPLSFSCLINTNILKSIADKRIFLKYRSGTVNSNTVNSKFHLIRSYCKYLATILSFHV